MVALKRNERRHIQRVRALHATAHRHLLQTPNITFRQKQSMMGFLTLIHGLLCIAHINVDSPKRRGCRQMKICLFFWGGAVYLAR